MALQNIGAGNSDDAFYRYKMPRMLTKIEGRGNGIRTNVVNMVDIAKALAGLVIHHPASYTTKYFGYKLGAQSKFDEKAGMALVNGAHDTAKLAGLLDNFIKKFTEVIITKTKMIQLKCAACGVVSDVDVRDKLTAFIGGKDKKAMRRAEKERLKEGEAADDNWATDTSLEAARKRIQEQLSSVTADTVMLTTVEAKKEKPKPVAKKAAAPTNGSDAAAAANDDPKAKSSTVTQNGKSANGIGAHKQLVEKIQGNLRGRSVGKLKSFLGSLNGGWGSNSPQDVMTALIAALLEKKNYLAAATHDNEGPQILLMRAIDAFCEKSGLVKEVALVLKRLYDEDVLEEEYIVQWFNEGTAASGRQIWKNVKLFIVWLRYVKCLKSKLLDVFVWQQKVILKQMCSRDARLFLPSYYFIMLHTE
ncbi:hypothetical protein MKW92_047787 [Papaver armeniacum]|nr:hypothetical protein MKW92_047787 [Papaver armeniacum]